MQALVQDAMLTRLVLSFCDLPIFGEGSLSKEGGAAFLFHYFISPIILFNLLLDDLDVELEMRFKNLTYFYNIYKNSRLLRLVLFFYLMAF